MHALLSKNYTIEVRGLKSKDECLTERERERERTMKTVNDISLIHVIKYPVSLIVNNNAY